jgi:hypothetical protein
MDRRLLTVCAWVVVLFAGMSPPTSDPGPRPFDIAATAARLDALDVQVTGSLEEHRASEILSYHRIEGGMADCMRAAGHPYRKPPLVSFYRDFTDADFGYGNGRATVVDSLTAGPRLGILNEIAYARLDRAGVFDPPVSPADVGALNGCRAKFGGRLYFDGELPTYDGRLLGFYDLLEPVDHDAGVIQAMVWYRRCMRDRYGYIVDDRDDFLYTPRIDGRDAPIDGAPASAAWRRGVAEMERVFAADADCRRPAYEAGMRIVAGRLDGWANQHRTEIAAVRREWRQRVADAAKLPR